MLHAEHVTKDYIGAEGPIRILDGLDLRLARGDAAAIMGPSGSGKSTLLHLLGAMDRPTSGSVQIDGVEVSNLPEGKQAEFRNRSIGFVFQDHALLPQCSVIENVLVPTLVAGRSESHIDRARNLLDAVALSHRLHHRPAQLSGGERQRAAIARALIMQPALVLCDEPTGNLDRASAESVADLLLRLHREHNSVLVVVTHSTELADRFGTRYELRDRRLVQT